MQARSAYISSLSTTAILVGAALLMLTLLGAVVGFRGWPHVGGGQSIDPVGVSAEPMRPASATRALPAAPPPGRPAPTAAPTTSSVAPAVATAAPAPAPQQRSLPPVEVLRTPPPSPGASRTYSEPPARHSPPVAPLPPPQPPPAPAPLQPVIEPLIAPVTSLVDQASASTPLARGHHAAPPAG